mmetsp:Transcript_32955/g.77675  ORF Transcript_32955/g.77675 Transcript_32955/m.77675 type:complete len:244 (+) Transcript_32955:2752-3483(+)
MANNDTACFLVPSHATSKSSTANFSSAVAGLTRWLEDSPMRVFKCWVISCARIANRSVSSDFSTLSIPSVPPADGNASSPSLYSCSEMRPSPSVSHSAKTWSSSCCDRITPLLASILPSPSLLMASPPLAASLKTSSMLFSFGVLEAVKRLSSVVLVVVVACAEPEPSSCIMMIVFSSSASLAVSTAFSLRTESSSSSFFVLVVDTVPESLSLSPGSESEISGPLTFAVFAPAKGPADCAGTP